MRELIVIILMIFTGARSVTAQNVGIGTTTPSEKLDVNGNINVTGTIKANGVDGTAGQVLMKNSSGSLSWGDMSEFRNRATFRTVGAGTWTVPAGITRVWVEVWGGGSGGSYYIGGGGGAYAGAVFDVTPGGSISYTVGDGGSGGGTNSLAGGQSRASFGTITIICDGGFASSFVTPGNFIQGGGGAYSVFGTLNFIGSVGGSGKPVRATVMQTGASTFYEISDGGDGGDAGNTVGTGGLGGYAIFNTVTGSSALRIRGGGIGRQPGGGGGAGYLGTIGSSGFTNGTQGAVGMVIIHY